MSKQNRQTTNVRENTTLKNILTFSCVLVHRVKYYVNIHL